MLNAGKLNAVVEIITVFNLFDFTFMFITSIYRVQVFVLSTSDFMRLLHTFLLFCLYS